MLLFRNLKVNLEIPDEAFCFCYFWLVCHLKEGRSYFLNHGPERHALLADYDLIHRIRWYFTNMITRAACFLLGMLIMMIPNYAIFKKRMF